MIEMSYLLSMAFGFLFGVLTILFTSWLLIKLERNKLKKQAEEIKAKQKELKDKYESVRPRLRKAAEISNRQLDLYSQTQQPSMNALHSKYKNDLIHEIKELEKEKRTILRSIIKEGYDPELDLTNEKDGKEIVKLSEYMSRNGISLTDETEEKPEENARVTKNGKFFIIDGGKSDVTH